MKYVILLSVVLLGGCVQTLPLRTMQPAPKHHVAKQPAKPAPAPAVVAPAPPVSAPSPKQTFKHRWLRLFFRERAVNDARK